MSMDQIVLKTRELGAALLDTDQYRRMRDAEERAMHDPNAGRLMTELLENRTALHEEMSAENPDPMRMKQISDTLDGLQESLQSIDAVVQMTEARAEFNALVSSINQMLQYIVSGKLDSDCSGDCNSCGGCH